MNEWLQILGALLVLAAFAAAQLQALRPESYPYLILNLVGSAILAALAYAGKQSGFLLLEGVWALVSLGSLLARAGRTARVLNH